MRKNIVVVACGVNSIHEHWISHWREEMSWDLLCVNYGNSTHLGTITFKNLEVSKKFTKTQLLNQLLDQELLSSYEYIWFPDDDIKMDTNTINNFFDSCKANEVFLAQPSLDASSYIAHPVTLNHSNFLYRRTNFIEVMLVCFSNAAWSALRKKKRYISTTGFGMELFWTTNFNPINFKFIIFDSIKVTHTRPIGLSYHEWIDNSINIQNEMESLISEHSLNKLYGWHRCNISGMLDNLGFVNYDNPNLIVNIILSISKIYRNPGINLGGLPLTKSRNLISNDCIIKMKNILGHSSFGEYIIMQQSINDWVNLSKHGMQKYN
jgi:hypothetical protein